MNNVIDSFASMNSIKYLQQNSIFGNALDSVNVNGFMNLLAASRTNKKPLKPVSTKKLDSIMRRQSAKMEKEADQISQHETNISI